MDTIRIKTSSREQLLEITDEVRSRLRAAEIKQGIVVLFVQHTTAGITINENADPDVPRDMLLALKTLVPQFGMDFRHFEHNADAHIKSSLMGSSVTIPVLDGELVLGRWQGIFLCEFDGPKERNIAMITR